jgi:hypothetical protein
LQYSYKPKPSWYPIGSRVIHLPVDVLNNRAWAVDTNVASNAKKTTIKRQVGLMEMTSERRDA